MIEKTVDVINDKRLGFQKTVLHCHTVVSQFVQSADAAGGKNHDVGFQQFDLAVFERIFHHDLADLLQHFVFFIKFVIFAGGNADDRRDVAVILVLTFPPVVQHAAGNRAHHSGIGKAVVEAEAHFGDFGSHFVAFLDIGGIFAVTVSAGNADPQVFG